MFGPLKVCRGIYLLLRIPDDRGEPETPTAPIDVNAFHTTNFRSTSAMLGAEFNGNTHCESTTRILSI